MKGRIALYIIDGDSFSFISHMPRPKYYSPAIDRFFDRARSPPSVRAGPENASANALGIRRIILAVDDVVVVPVLAFTF